MDILPKMSSNPWVTRVVTLAMVSTLSAASLQWSFKQQRPRTSILDLSDDILLEIMYSADLPSILLLRQTCRRLCRVSKTFSLWLNTLKFLAASCPTREILDTCRPLSTYTAKELETMVVKLVRLERKWSTPNPLPDRIRDLGELPKLSNCEFIPGGRWFIATTAEDPGRVVYYDFEEASLAPKLLVGACEETGPGYAASLTLSVDADCVTLEFDMVLMYQESEDQRSFEKYMTVSTWRVTLDPGSGRLNAVPLGSFRLWGKDNPYDSLSLREGLLLRAAIYRRWIVHYEVLSLADCSNDSLLKAVVVPEKQEYQSVLLLKLRLLPGNQFLAVTHTRFMVYGIGEFHSSDADRSPSQPIWSFSYREPSFGESPGYEMGLAISPAQAFRRRLKSETVFCYYKGVVWMIKVSLNGQPNITTLRGLPEVQHPRNYRKMACIGRSRGVWCIHYGEILAAAMISWAPQVERAAFRAFAGLPDIPADLKGAGEVNEVAYMPSESLGMACWLFEETSGRVIYATPGKGRRFLLLDFV